MWEDYVIDLDNTHAWFRSADRDDAKLIERILTDLATEARTYVLDQQADDAEAAIADVRRARRASSRRR